MSRRTAVRGRLAGGILLAAVLLWTTTSSAQEETPLPAEEGNPPRSVATPQVELTVHGVYGSYRPAARVRLDRPGHLALFEVEPGVGATMLYPDDAADPARFSAGTHELRLDGLPVATRRRLTTWHLGRAFVHRVGLALDNHLVAVVSEEPLDVSELRSQRVFRYTKVSAGAGEVTEALLEAVAGHLAAERWDAARASYLKFRDPWLLTASGPWLDAPFLPLQRILAFTGWPSHGSQPFLFTCGPSFAATGAYFSGRASHDLAVCRHAIPDRRTLADLSRQDPRARAEGVTAADGREASGSDDAGTEASATSASREAERPLPEHVRSALRRIADADRRDDEVGTLPSLRRIESFGKFLSARGVDVDVDRLRTLRRKAETRARFLDRVGAGSGSARGIPPADRAAGAGLRGGKSRADRSPVTRNPSARPSTRDVRDRPRTLPANRPATRKPRTKKPRTSGDGTGDG